MGLDSYLWRRGITPKGRVMIALNSDRSQDEELGYWRKEWDIHGQFCSYASMDIIEATPDCNCVEIPISKEDLIDMINWINHTELPIDVKDYTIQVIKKALESDFDNEEVFYYAWF